MEKLKKEAFLNLSEDEKRSLLSGWNESYEAEAVIEYLTYVGVHNLDVHFLGELARAYNNDSEEERAMEILDSVSESQRDAQWYYRYAYSYLYRNFPIDEQDKSNALFLLEKAVKLSKDDKMKDRSVELVNFCELGSAGLFWVKSGESRFIRIPEERKDPTRVPVLLSSAGAVLIISEVSQKIWKMSSFDAELVEMRVENWHQKGTSDSFAAHIMTTDENGTFPVILSAGSQMNAGDCFTLLFIDWNQNVARWSEECSYLYEKETTREKHLQVLAERESFDAYTNPQIGSIMYKDGSIFAFTEGDVINPHRLGSSNYFWYLELTEQGIYRKKIWGEERLKARKGKHGLRGKFSAQKDYLILSPIFDKEEWKGKQKVLSLENLNLLDLQLPRGFTKYRLLDIWNDHAFLTDDETGLAVCTFKLV